MANNAIQIFDGTPTTVITQTATISSANFSVDSTNATHASFDNSTDLWPLAVATLIIGETFSAAPTVGSSIDLYMIEQNVGGTTSDIAPPTTTLVKGAKYVGSFAPLYAVDENQVLTCVISLAGVQEAKFSIYNGSGVNISYSSGGTLVKIEGFTLTPSA